MPATEIIILERTGTIAAGIAPYLRGQPVNLKQPRSLAAFTQAIAGKRFAIVLLECKGNEPHLGAILSQAEQWHAIVVLRATSLAMWPGLDMREMGVAAILPPHLPSEHWGSTIQLLIQESQRRFHMTGS
jgi:hypothetical protein